MKFGDATAVYLDTNAIILSVEASEEALLFLIEKASSEPLRLHTSELTLAEILVGPLKSGNLGLVAQYEESLTSWRSFPSIARS
jgi:predicted nucleic acid-binding protein